MTISVIQIDALPAQTFSAQLGDNLLRLSLQWQVRFGYFRVDIEGLTYGRVLNPGVDLLDDVYPPGIERGRLLLLGDQPTPENLGIDNQLVWTDE